MEKEINCTISTRQIANRITDKQLLVAILLEDNYSILNCLYEFEKQGIRWILVNSYPELLVIQNRTPIRYVVSTKTTIPDAIADTNCKFLFHTSYQNCKKVKSDTHHCIAASDGNLIEISKVFSAVSKEAFANCIGKVSNVSYDYLLNAECAGLICLLGNQYGWRVERQKRDCLSYNSNDTVVISESGLFQLLRDKKQRLPVKKCILIADIPLVQYHLVLLKKIFPNTLLSGIYAGEYSFKLPILTYSSLDLNERSDDVFSPLNCLASDTGFTIINHTGSTALRGIPGELALAKQGEVYHLNQRVLMKSDGTLRFLIQRNKVIEHFFMILLPLEDLQELCVLNKDMTLSCKKESELVRIKKLLKEYFGDATIEVKEMQNDDCDDSELSQQHNNLHLVFERILKTSKLKDDDDLFSYGLNSVKAVAAVVALKELGIEITMEQIYQNPTVSQLGKVAGKISELQQKERNEDEILFIDEHDALMAQHVKEQGNIEDVYPMTDIQTGSYAQLVNLIGSGREYSLLSFTIKGALDLERFQKAWSEMFHLHPLLRSGFLRKGFHCPVQVVYKQIMPLISYKNLTLKSTNAREKIYRQDLEDGHMNLEFPPLIKLYLYQIDKMDYRFFLKTPNSLFDGWSASVLLDDFLTLYDLPLGYQEQESRQPDPCADFIKWHNQIDLSEAKEYFQQLFGNKFYAEKLPIHSILPIMDMKEIVLEIPQMQHQRMLEILNSIHISPILLFLAAWADVNRENEQEAVVGMAFSGRLAPIPGILHMVGLFSNILPVCVKPIYGNLLDWFRLLQRDFLYCRSMNSFQ